MAEDNDDVSCESVDAESELGDGGTLRMLGSGSAAMRPAGKRKGSAARLSGKEGWGGEVFRSDGGSFS